MFQVMMLSYCCCCLVPAADAACCLGYAVKAEQPLGIDGFGDCRSIASAGGGPGWPHPGTSVAAVKRYVSRPAAVTMAAKQSQATLVQVPPECRPRSCKSGADLHARVVSHEELRSLGTKHSSTLLPDPESHRVERVGASNQKRRQGKATDQCY